MYRYNGGSNILRSQQFAEGLDVAQGDQKIQLVFIINGANFSLETNINAPLKEAVARALAESGNTGRPPSEWPMRHAAGVFFENGRKIKECGVTNWTRLFLL